MDKPIIYNPDKLLWLPENYDKDMITKSFRLKPKCNNLDDDINFKQEITEDIIYLEEIICLENELKELKLKYDNLERKYKFTLKVKKIYESLLFFRKKKDLLVDSYDNLSS